MGFQVEASSKLGTAIMSVNEGLIRRTKIQQDLTRFMGGLGEKGATVNEIIDAELGELLGDDFTGLGKRGRRKMRKGALSGYSTVFNKRVEEQVDLVDLEMQ